MKSGDSAQANGNLYVSTEQGTQVPNLHLESALHKELSSSSKCLSKTE